MKPGYFCAIIIFQHKIKICENAKENIKNRPVQTTSE